MPDDLAMASSGMKPLSGRWSRMALGALAFTLIAVALRFLPAFAQDGDPPPERRVVQTVADEGYLWWLKQWSNSEEICELLIGHSGLPTWDEVSTVCGAATFEEWVDTSPCFEAVDGEDTSDCDGLYLLYAGYLEGERVVVQELPSPSISISGGVFFIDNWTIGIAIVRYTVIISWYSILSNSGNRG